MVLHRSAKADLSRYPGSIPGVSVIEAGYCLGENLCSNFLREAIRKFQSEVWVDSGCERIKPKFWNDIAEYANLFK